MRHLFAINVSSPPSVYIEYFRENNQLLLFKRSFINQMIRNTFGVFNRTRTIKLNLFVGKVFLINYLNNSTIFEVSLPKAKILIRIIHKLHSFHTPGIAVSMSIQEWIQFSFSHR